MTRLRGLKLFEGVEKITEEYDQIELELGLEIEKEHDKTIEWLLKRVKPEITPEEVAEILPIAREMITKNHLDEIPDYNSRLKRLEKEAGISESSEKLIAEDDTMFFKGIRTKVGGITKDLNSSFIDVNRMIKKLQMLHTFKGEVNRLAKVAGALDVSQDELLQVHDRFKELENPPKKEIHDPRDVGLPAYNYQASWSK